MEKKNICLFCLIFIIIFSATMPIQLARLVKGDVTIGYIYVYSPYASIFTGFHLSSLIIIIPHLSICGLIAFLLAKLWIIFANNQVAKSAALFGRMLFLNGDFVDLAVICDYRR